MLFQAFWKTRECFWMSAFKKNYINFGWLSDRAIYIDTITKEFYLTDIEKNSNGIMLL